MLKNNLLIFADNVVFPKGELREGPFYVVIKRGIITKISKAESAVSSVTQCERCDAVTCHLLSPGFVDIHNYGHLQGGEDVLENWKKPDYTCGNVVTSGTTSLLATVVFPAEEQKGDEVLSVLKVLEKRVGRKGIGAVIEGVNAEGPLISYSGGSPKEMDAKEFENLLDEIPGLKIMTVSPHVAAKKNYQPIKMLHERGVVPLLGHDLQADEQEIIDALSASESQPCHITHPYNTSNFHNRNPGLVNFGLLDKYPSISKYESAVPPTIELIGDMIHLHPLAVQILLTCRSGDQIAFVTDCMVAKQSKPTIISEDRRIKVDKENNVIKTCNDDVKSCTMLDIFKNLINDFEVPVGKAIMMLSENPARIAKLDNVGTIEVGKDANLLMFDAKYNLMKTFVDGRMAFRTSSCRRKRIVSTESFDESFM